MDRTLMTGWSRRRLMAALAAAPIAAGLPGDVYAAEAAAAISAETAQKRLVAGNRRFVAGAMRHIDYPRRREAVAPKQKPFAIILGCADSRVPPEIVFDQGLGDLFILRVAGNVADDLALGSMEYAVDHFHTPLLVVLGHERCGAVSAAVEAVKSGEMPPPHIASLVEAIRPAVEASKDMPGDPVENAVRANVRHTVAALKSSHPVLAAAVEQKRLAIVGAEYGLASGRVAFIG
jgi:carbonic anhydrase